MGYIGFFFSRVTFCCLTVSRDSACSVLTVRPCPLFLRGYHLTRHRLHKLRFGVQLAAAWVDLAVSRCGLAVRSLAGKQKDPLIQFGCLLLVCSLLCFFLPSVVSFFFNLKKILWFSLVASVSSVLFSASFFLLLFLSLFFNLKKT